MKTLSKILYLLSLLVLLSSCRTTRRTLSSEHISISDSSLYLNVSSGASSIQSSLSNINGTWKVTYYDVSMPRDTLTGMHPVVAVAEGNYNEVNSSYIQTSDSTSQSYASSHHSSDVDNTDESMEQERDSSTFFDKFSKLLMSISLLIFISVTSYIALKIIRRR